MPVIYIRPYFEASQSQLLSETMIWQVLIIPHISIIQILMKILDRPQQEVIFTLTTAMPYSFP